jgi:hypothetical protein
LLGEGQIMIELGLVKPPDDGLPPRARLRRLAVVAFTVMAVGLAAVGVFGVPSDRPDGSAPTGATTRVPAPSGSATSPTDPAVQTDPVAAIPLSSLDVSVIANDRLVLPDGTNVTIPGSAKPRSGYQTQDGWLLQESGRLWLVTPDHSVHRLIDAASVAVAPDGRRFAWSTATTMSVGHLAADDTLVTDQTVPAPAEGVPDRYTGSAVILGAGCCDGVSTYDVWIPADGRYAPSWANTTSVRGVDAVRPGTSHLIGTVEGPAGGKDLCLAELDPATNLRAVWTACGIVQFRVDDGTVSPDGHWAAVRTSNPATGENAIGLVDLTRAAQAPQAVQYWTAESPGVWLDRTSMLCRGRDGHLWRFTVGRSEPELVSVPGVTDYLDTTVIPLQRLS